MIQPSSYKAPQYIIDKLSHLLGLLTEERGKYERAACSVTDRQFRFTISNIAQESNQYVCEITSQLRSLGVEADNWQDETKSIAMAELTSPPELSVEANAIQNNNILKYCKESEKQMIHAYRQLLNEPFLMEGIRKIIRVQLNGIMYTFLQLKLLSATT